MSEEAQAVESKDLDPHSMITESHVKATLKNDKGEKAKLTSWVIEDFTQKGDNYATIVTCVKVTYVLEGKTSNTSYVVKLNASKMFGHIKEFFTVLFYKEGGFYEQLAPLIHATLTNIGLKPLAIPKWYYNHLEEKQECIFMEDLRLKDFKMFDRKKGMDVPHTRLVLQELARLHAASILLQANHPREDLAEKFTFLQQDWHHYDGHVEENLKMMFEPNFDLTAAILNRIGGYELAEKWLSENKTNGQNLLKKHLVKEEPFKVICHGDCWNNNMLFRYNDEGDPVEVMLVDLQVNRVASLATDLNYLMFTSLTGEVRRANTREFLKCYYSSFNEVLEAAGKPMPFTFEQLQQEYKNRHEYGLLFGMLCCMIIVRPANDVPDFGEDAKEEDIPKLIEKFKENTLDMLERNPLFKPRFAAIFDDMTANGVFD